MPLQGLAASFGTPWDHFLVCSGWLLSVRKELSERVKGETAHYSLDILKLCGRLWGGGLPTVPFHLTPLRHLHVAADLQNPKTCVFPFKASSGARTQVQTFPPSLSVHLDQPQLGFLIPDSQVYSGSETELLNFGCTWVHVGRLRLC